MLLTILNLEQSKIRYSSLLQNTNCWLTTVNLTKLKDGLNMWILFEVFFFPCSLIFCSCYKVASGGCSAKSMWSRAGPKWLPNCELCSKLSCQIWCRWKLCSFRVQSIPLCLQLHLLSEFQLHIMWTIMFWTMQFGCPVILLLVVWSSYRSKM